MHPSKQVNMLSCNINRLHVAGAAPLRVHRSLLARPNSCSAVKQGTVERGGPAVSHAYTEQELSAMKVVDLRQLLREQQLPVSGRKAELVSRILCNVSDVSSEPVLDARSNLEDAARSPYEAVIVGSQGAEETGVEKHSMADGSRKMSLRFVDLKQIDQEARVQAIQSSVKLLAMWFLGTCSAAAPSSANGPSLSLRVGSDIWFFDCADDTQRQLQRVSTGGPETGIKYLKASRIFLTALDGARLFGLPGLLCQLSMVKGESDAQGSVPVHVYGPEGVAAFLNVVLATSDTCLFVPVIVFEFVPGPVEGGFSDMECLNSRARLYRVRVPADDYNPEGYTDVSAQNRQWYPRKDVHGRSRGQRLAHGRGGKVDDRGYWRPPILPEAGDPDHPGRAVEELKWTLLCDSSWKVEVSAADFAQPCASQACNLADHPYHTPQPGINVSSNSPTNSQSCWDHEQDIALAYTVFEPARSGSIVMEAATALGLKPGRGLHDLKHGMPVVNSAGVTVLPEQVCTPDEPGRVLLITGQRIHVPSLTRNSPSVDMVLADIVTGESTGLEAAGLCTHEAVVELARDTGASAVVAWARCEASGGRLRPCSEESEMKLREELKKGLREDVLVAVPDMLELAAVTK